MSRKLKIMGLATVAVLAMSAFAASFAQAASPEWFVGGSPLVGSEGEESEGGPFQLAIPARSITIECGTETNSGTITAPRQDLTHVEFTGCEVVGAPACEVAEPIVTDAATELVVVGNRAYDKFRPASGTLFTEIIIEGCAAEGEFEVTGETCGEGEELGVELVEQPLRFSKETVEACGSAGLKFGGTEATLTGESIQVVTSGQAFGVR